LKMILVATSVTQHVLFHQIYTISSPTFKFAKKQMGQANLVRILTLVSLRFYRHVKVCKT